MNSDLVHSPSFWNGAYQRKLFVWVVFTSHSQHALKLREGWTAIRVDALFEPNPGGYFAPLPQNRGVNSPLFLLGPTKGDRMITLLYMMRLHLAAEGASCVPGFCNQCESARFPVQSVDDRDAHAVDSFVGKEVA